MLVEKGLFCIVNNESKDFLICAKELPSNGLYQKKVWISKVFNINSKKMSILEGQFFMCPTPCEVALLYILQAVHVCVHVPSFSQISFYSTKKSWLILHFWMFLNYFYYDEDKYFLLISFLNTQSCVLDNFFVGKCS